MIWLNIAEQISASTIGIMIVPLVLLLYGAVAAHRIYLLRCNPPEADEQQQQRRHSSAKDDDTIRLTRPSPALEDRKQLQKKPRRSRDSQSPALADESSSPSLPSTPKTEKTWTEFGWSSTPLLFSAAAVNRKRRE